ncbi:MAG: DUF1674 domain-containing protein [Hyphomicrobiaceae bacterium]
MAASDTTPDVTKAGDSAAGADTVRQLTPAAERALKEAEERRALREAQVRSGAKSETKSGELGGRAGPDPVRYGDWENGGIASDF